MKGASDLAELTGGSPPSGTPPSRMLTFCWGDPRLARNYSIFLDYLKARLPCDPLIVTADQRGALLYLAHGFQSLTLADAMHLASGDSHSGEFDNCRLPDDSEIDLAAMMIRKPRRSVDGKELVRDYHHLYDWLARAFEADCVMTWNGGLLCQRALTNVGRHHGLPVIFVERGLFPDTFFVDPLGVNHSSSVAGERWPPPDFSSPNDKDLARLERQLAGYHRKGESVVRAGSSAGSRELRRALGIPNDATICLFPLQIETDTNILLFSPLYRAMADAVSAVEVALSGFPDVHLIVKPHPENPPDLAFTDIEMGGRTHVTSEYDLHSLLNVCDVVVTINSTVGLEGRCSGKPVVTLGDSVYSSKGFTIDVRRKEELSGALGLALESCRGTAKGEPELHQFLVYLMKNRLFPLSGEDPWQARSRIVGWIASSVATPARRNKTGSDLLQTLENNRRVRQWLAEERDDEKERSLRVVCVGRPSEALIRDVFSGALRSTRMVSGLGSAIACLVGGLIRPYDLVVAFDDLSGKKRLVYSILAAKERLHFR